MDSPSTNSSSQKTSTGASRTKLPALSTTSLTPPEPVQSSNTSYTATQSTPNALAMKMASQMPPVAMAPPLGHVNLIQSRLPGGSNMPIGPHDMYQSGPPGGDPNHPIVTVMAMAPPGVSGDAQVDNVRFTCLQQCRWMAGCLMAYYAVTFLFLQPFVLGILGLFTAFIGYNGSRSPVGMHRYKWLCWYIRATYGMLVLNMWMLIVTLVFSGALFRPDSEVTYGSLNSDDDDVASSTSLHTKSASLVIGIVVAINTVFHLRCLRMAKLLAAELLSAGVDREPVPSLVVAPANPASVV
uniref:Uncharacterized protein n=1 Tax=Peronospora matthiolae TaxID=2874970 RepID=A0AAV1UWI6_9STRA